MIPPAARGMAVARSTQDERLLCVIASPSLVNSCFRGRTESTHAAPGPSIPTVITPGNSARKQADQISSTKRRSSIKAWLGTRRLMVTRRGGRRISISRVISPLVTDM